MLVLTLQQMRLLVAQRITESARATVNLQFPLTILTPKLGHRALSPVILPEQVAPQSAQSAPTNSQHLT